MSKQAAAIKKNIRSLQQSLNDCDRELDRIGNQRAELVAEIRAARNELALCELVVSDHAVCRYLERHMNIDIEQLRERLTPASMQAAYKVLGDGRYPIADGGVVVVKNRHVVTVL